ncbi:uncharacterized protein CC84DRAFT_610976 [Paraphaeosphaeria sporulosa]|uniref:Uncharacterized protein n=1 Tax=Paraphaeosphaeria sporulosa TaxID=1460663 RepID=A0A177CHJ7_9PLEO|nr:uncharacterized protein CC84DRAFT_610976 [Paraphaeosphaeria sporulosa]OAG06691.1 hypothetical protein CC84DRAFT_610976 [Paraphaeosphaeria sporulosa]
MHPTPSPHASNPTPFWAYQLSRTLCSPLSPTLPPLPGNTSSLAPPKPSPVSLWCHDIYHFASFIRICFLHTQKRCPCHLRGIHPRPKLPYSRSVPVLLILLLDILLRCHLVNTETRDLRSGQPVHERFCLHLRFDLGERVGISGIRWILLIDRKVLELQR